MTVDNFLFVEDPFDNFDPIPEEIYDPFPPIEPEPNPEPPIVIDEPEPSLVIDDPKPILPNPEGGIGSNNSGWPCACTGLYI